MILKKLLVIWITLSVALIVPITGQTKDYLKMSRKDLLIEIHEGKKEIIAEKREKISLLDRLRAKESQVERLLNQIKDMNTRYLLALTEIKKLNYVPRLDFVFGLSGGYDFTNVVIDSSLLIGYNFNKNFSFFIKVDLLINFTPQAVPLLHTGVKYKLSL